MSPLFSLSCTRPNEFVAEVHDRMPVLLQPDQFDARRGEISRRRARGNRATPHDESAETMTPNHPERRLVLSNEPGFAGKCSFGLALPSL
jgi:hypothetical protein